MRVQKLFRERENRDKLLNLIHASKGVDPGGDLRCAVSGVEVCLEETFSLKVL